jgi:hypothetical protein
VGEGYDEGMQTQSNKVAEPLAAQSSKDVMITCTCFVGK